MATNFCRVCGKMTDGATLCKRCEVLLADDRYIILECEDDTKIPTGRALLYDRNPFEPNKCKNGNVVRMSHENFIHLLDED
jgi:folate-dependent tRNA-U54 methylase TrmFO/GidA